MTARADPRSGGSHRDHPSEIPASDSSRLNLVHIAGHQLDARVLEGLAGAVVHRDPAHDVHHVSLLRRDDVVIGLPAHAAGDIGELSGKLSRLVSCDAAIPDAASGCVSDVRSGKTGVPGIPKRNWPPTSMIGSSCVG